MSAPFKSRAEGRYSSSKVSRIMMEYGKDFLKEFPQPYEHYKVINHLLNCRTPKLGGHIDRCFYCEHQEYYYHSCRNRHCPLCGGSAKAKWLEKKNEELLAVPYFHVVFTLPHEINPLILMNKEKMLDLFFGSVSETLLEFGRNPKSRLCGNLGFSLFLHTWSQTLIDHFHLHGIIPGGVLQNGKKWKRVKRRKYLFKVENLSTVFRGKYLDKLQRLYQEGKIDFHGHTEPYQEPVEWKKFISLLYDKCFYVYCKPSLKTPETLMDYLSQYTHRTAISDKRILEVNNGEVLFEYLDRKKGNKKESMNLKATEFLRRFFLHVLPGGFRRIRHYGFMVNQFKKKNLELIRKQLKKQTHYQISPKTLNRWLKTLLKEDVRQCPVCEQGAMIFFKTLLPNPDWKIDFLSGDTS